MDYEGLDLGLVHQVELGRMTLDEAKKVQAERKATAEKTVKAEAKKKGA